MSKSRFIAQIVAQKIRDGELPNRSKLPSVPKLARDFSVSTYTIQRALDQLEREGLVIRLMRSGVYVKRENSPSLSVIPIKQTKPRAQEIAEHIVSQIAQGTLRAGEYLPLQKSLQFQYRTSKATLIRALKIVREKGIVTKKGSGNIVGAEPTDGAIRGKGQIFVIAKPDILKSWLFSRHDRLFFQSFEEELGRFGISALRFIRFPKSEQMFLDRIPRFQTIGFFKYIMRADTKERIQKELELLLKTGLPVVLFDAYTILSHSPHVRFNSGKKCFPIYGHEVRECEKLGSYLASLGHKSVAYFSFYDEPWCEWRLCGFKQGFQNVLGMDTKVNPYRMQGSRESIRKAAEVTTMDETQKQLVAKSVSQTLNGYPISESTCIEKFSNTLFDLVQEDSCKQDMLPLFEQAIAAKETTAWICSDPWITVAAAEFLKKKGITIPDDMSLAGFDNDESTALARITMLDFQFGRRGYLAAHCLLGDIPIKKNRHGFVECPARIVERGSVGRFQEKSK